MPDNAAMQLLAIIFGTLIAGVGSVWIAGWLTHGVLARYTQHLLSLAAGALLATAFMHLLPEAFESQAGAQALFATLLGGLLFFFLLDKAELYHHGHEHAHPPEHLSEHPSTDASVGTPAHGHAQSPHQHHHAPQGGGWAVLLGDSVHCFGDGILIAAAYMADMRLGVAATLAVLTHESPHHIGDLVILRQNAAAASQALGKLSAAGAVTVVGGVVGYILVDQLQNLLPYLLVIASSSFIYVALADLIPQLQTRLTMRQTTAQIAWLATGIIMVSLVSGLAHGH